MMPRRELDYDNGVPGPGSGGDGKTLYQRTNMNTDRTACIAAGSAVCHTILVAIRVMFQAVLLL